MTTFLRILAGTAGISLFLAFLVLIGHDEKKGFKKSLEETFFYLACVVGFLTFVFLTVRLMMFAFTGEFF